MRGYIFGAHRARCEWQARLADGQDARPGAALAEATDYVLKSRSFRRKWSETGDAAPPRPAIPAARYLEPSDI